MIRKWCPWTQEGSHRVPKFAWWVAVSRTEPIHHAVHRTSHWALLQITRRAPSLRWRGMDYLILRPWLRPTKVPPSNTSIPGIIQAEWMHIYNNLKTQVHENTNTDIIAYKERCINAMRSRSRDFGHCCHWSHFDVLSPLWYWDEFSLASIMMVDLALFQGNVQTPTVRHWHRNF